VTPNPWKLLRAGRAGIGLKHLARNGCNLRRTDRTWQRWWWWWWCDGEL